MDRSWIPTVAGVLNIFAGGLALVGVVALSFGAFVVSCAPEIDPDEFGIFIAKTVLIGLAFGVLILALLAVLGGIFALQRKRWGFVLAGSISAAFVCPPLGVPAIVLTVLAERDLRERNQSQTTD